MSIEEAIRARLLTMTAVTGITRVIRPRVLMQNEKRPAIMIGVNQKNYENTLDGRCDMASASVSIFAISNKWEEADQLAEAIRTNGTDPGTGLGPCRVTTGPLQYQMMLTEQNVGFEPFDDGSELGDHFVESVYEMMFYQSE